MTSPPTKLQIRPSPTTRQFVRHPRLHLCQPKRDKIWKRTSSRTSSLDSSHGLTDLSLGWRSRKAARLQIRLRWWRDQAHRHRGIRDHGRAQPSVSVAASRHIQHCYVDIAKLIHRIDKYLEKAHKSYLRGRAR